MLDRSDDGLNVSEYARWSSAVLLFEGPPRKERRFVEKDCEWLCLEDTCREKELGLE